MPPPPSESAAVRKQLAAREVIDILMEISTLLNTHLDRSTLSMCASLIENGVNPEALATVVKELRKEAEEGRMEAEAARR